MPVFRGVVSIAHPSLGGEGSNTWHCRTVSVTNPGITADLVILTGMLEDLYNGLNDVLAGGTLCTFDGEWIQIDSEEPEIHDVPGWSSASGTSTAPLPPANSMVISWRTNLASKRARGRTFVGPLGVNTLQDNGTPTEAARGLLDGHAEAFIEAFDGAFNGAFGVWSQLDAVLRDFTGASTANRFAVLRSRRD